MRHRVSSWHCQCRLQDPNHPMQPNLIGLLIQCGKDPKTGGPLHAPMSSLTGKPALDSVSDPCCGA